MSRLVYALDRAPCFLDFYVVDAEIFAAANAELANEPQKGLGEYEP